MVHAGKGHPETMTRDLRELVTELMKEVPDTPTVRKLSEKTGIQYSEDPIELMSTVLKAINSACSNLTKSDRREPSEETSL